MITHRNSRARWASIGRALLMAALAAVGVGVVVRARRAGYLTLAPEQWRSWRATTDPASVVLPVLILCVAALGLVALVLGTGYVGLRALGWGRSARLVGALLVPHLRARLDRVVALGALSSFAVVGAGVLPAAADVVRQPEPVVVTDPGGLVDREEPSRDSVGSSVRPPEPDDHESIPTNPGAPDTTDLPDLPDVAENPVLPVPSGPPPGSTASAVPAVPGASHASGVPDGSRGPAAPASGRTYTVVAGDNLWTIAAAQVDQARRAGLGSSSDRDTAHYWVRLIEANRSTLRSGNPSLIFPGEVLALPALG